MSGLVRWPPILLCALLMSIAPCMAADEDWTVVTLARDGSWGVACSRTQPQAIAEAIRFCRAMSGGSSDCGAQLTATRGGGWTVANLCGNHKVIATGDSLADAETEALNREISLQLFYVPDLPRCRRVVTVNSGRSTVTSSLAGFLPLDTADDAYHASAGRAAIGVKGRAANRSCSALAFSPPGMCMALAMNTEASPAAWAPRRSVSRPSPMARMLSLAIGWPASLAMVAKACS